MSVGGFHTVAVTVGRGLHTWGGVVMIIWLNVAGPVQAGAVGRARRGRGMILLQGTAEAGRAIRAWPGDAGCGM